MSNKLHTMPIHCEPLLSSRRVRNMKLDEFGAYMKLLIEAWLEEARLPSEEVELRAILGLSSEEDCAEWMRIKKFVIDRMFKPSEDGLWLTNPKQVEIYQDVLGGVEARRRGGRATASRRWGVAQQGIQRNSDSSAIAQLNNTEDFDSSANSSATFQLPLSNPKSKPNNINISQSSVFSKPPTPGKESGTKGTEEIRHEFDGEGTEDKSQGQAKGDFRKSVLFKAWTDSGKTEERYLHRTKSLPELTQDEKDCLELSGIDLEPKRLVLYRRAKALVGDLTFAEEVHMLKTLTIEGKINEPPAYFMTLISKAIAVMR